MRDTIVLRTRWRQANLRHGAAPSLPACVSHSETETCCTLLCFVVLWRMLDGSLRLTSSSRTKQYACYTPSALAVVLVSSNSSSRDKPCVGMKNLAPRAVSAIVQTSSIKPVTRTFPAAFQQYNAFEYDTEAKKL